MDLSAFPRVSLAVLPTPLQRLDRLTAALGGPEIWVKRDDMTGLALGGNKTRKLEYLLAAAQAEGADCVLTAGGVQSNHVRQTAAAAARLGLACELVLSRNVPGTEAVYERTGNLQLDRLLGATVTIHPAATDRDAVMAARAEALRLEGRRPYVIPVGGSNPVGSLGYVAAAREIAEQAQAAGLTIDHLIHACSSGGTHAGLAAGLSALEHPALLSGIDVEGNPDLEDQMLKPLAVATAAFAGIDEAGAAARVTLVQGYAGEGYGIPTTEMREAVEMAARLEGLVLDPVYSGKAMAGLIGLIREGTIAEHETVIYLHTGGMPALFAYPGFFSGETSS